MMNLVALFLVVSSLVSAGMWSPSPQDNQNQQKQGEHREVIVKNGHRVVVVEYDEHGHHNTKVLISPEPDNQAHIDSPSISNNEVSSPSRVSRGLDNAMENIKQASFPNLGQGLSNGEGHSPKELICDAYGECKHMIGKAIETKKEIVKGTAHGAKETAQKVGEVVENAYEKAGEAVENVYEKVSDKATEVKETMSDKAHEMKETVSDKVHEVEETAKETMGKAKDAAKTAKEMGDTMAGDIQRNVSRQREYLEGKAKEAKESAEHAADKVKAGAEELKSGTQKRFRQLGHKGREIWYGALRSMSGVLDALMSVAQLFGLATAYGMCMWITFISSHVLSGNLSPQQFGMVQSKIYRVYFKAMAFSVGMTLLGHLWRNRGKMLTGKAANMWQNYNLMAALGMILANMLYLEPRSTKVMFNRMKLEKEEGRERERVHVGARVGVEAEQQPIGTEGRGHAGARIRVEARQQPVTTEGEASTRTPSQVSERREQEVVEADIGRLNQMRDRLKKLNTYSSVLNVMSLMALSWHLVYLAQHLHSWCW